MGTEQKKVKEQLSELQSRIKEIDANQQKLLKASKTDGEASETDDEASKKAGDEAPNEDDEEKSSVRNAEKWVRELKDKVHRPNLHDKKCVTV